MHLAVLLQISPSALQIGEMGAIATDSQDFTLAPSPRGLLLERVRIYSDFDGTITQKDTLRLLLERFSAQDWPAIEQALDSGRITEREAVVLAFKKFPLSVEEAIEFVSTHIDLRAGFDSFLLWVDHFDIPLTILSAGFQQLIVAYLKRKHPSASFEIFANSAIDKSGNETGWNVRNFSIDPLCSRCSHCKTQSMFTHSNPDLFRVYIGDGLTDFCPSEFADLVFARGSLKERCEREGIPFVPFETFYEVQIHLNRLLSSPSLIGRRKNTKKIKECGAPVLPFDKIETPRLQPHP